MMRDPNIDKNWTIFTSLYEALKKKELKRLRLAKCTECGRATPYRLKSLEITTIQCKKCAASITIRAR